MRLLTLRTQVVEFKFVEEAFEDLDAAELARWREAASLVPS